MAAKIKEEVFTKEIIEEINAIFRRGGWVELKIENGKMLIIEVHRKVKEKTSIRG